MSLSYVNKAYNLSINVGDVVTYTGNGAPVRMVVVGAENAHLKLVHEDRPSEPYGLYHPTWEIQYGAPDGK